jgi:hypothetical protein
MGPLLNSYLARSTRTGAFLKCPFQSFLHKSFTDLAHGANSYSNGFGNLSGVIAFVGFEEYLGTSYPDGRVSSGTG